MAWELVFVDHVKVCVLSGNGRCEIFCVPGVGEFAAANGDAVFGGSGLRTAQSLPVIPMGPPPASDGSSLLSFSTPSQYTGPPGPPVFSSLPRPLQSAHDAQHSRGPSNFAEVPLALHSSAPLAENGHAGSLGDSNQQGLLEDEFDAYSLSASAPFVLFSAQKVILTGFYVSRLRIWLC